MEQSTDSPGRPLPRLITVAGLSKSGKTTVVEALVSELLSRGHEVGTVKTMRHHPLSLDAPGTDSLRHSRAGASVVVAIHAEGTARFQKGAPPRSLSEVAGLFPENIRIIICEGTLEQTEPPVVVLCLRAPADLQETLAIRGITRDSVIAISGAGALSWRQKVLPSFDVMAFDVTDPDQRKALADLLLTRIAQEDIPARKARE